LPLLPANSEKWREGPGQPWTSALPTLQLLYEFGIGPVVLRHDDVLCALDYFRSAGDAPDFRLTEAIHILRSKRQPDGT
jgi:hypothetical protein